MSGSSPPLAVLAEFEAALAARPDPRARSGGRGAAGVPTQPPTDPLTGLFGRSHFDATLGAHVDRCLRHQSWLSLVLLDVDGLEALNEQWGRPAGDLALCRVARAVRLSVRSADIAYRLGEDEFGVILPDAGSAAARLVAGRIVTLLRVLRSNPAEPGFLGDVSASLGVAELSPAIRRTCEQLRVAAEQALGVAKQCGGDCVASGMEL